MTTIKPILERINELERQADAIRRVHDPSHPRNLLQRRWRTIQRELPPLGRPRGTGAYPSPESLEMALREAHAKLRRRNVRPRPDLMAHELCISRRRLHMLVNEHDVRAVWDELLYPN